MASVWAELKRRNVVKVAVAYAIVAWILIQVVGTVFPMFSFPAWTSQFVTVVILIGFPIAIIFAWAFELTPDGLKPTREVDQSESITHVTSQKWNYLIIGVLIFAVGFMFVDNYMLEDSDETTLVEQTSLPDPDPVLETPAPAMQEQEKEVLPNSVAVLPFDNLSADPDDAFFAAGIHDEILNELVKLRNLTVIARTSVLKTDYTNGTMTIPEIAEELNVQSVMEGSVRYAGDRVRITTQLIDAESGGHLWSEVYERELSDIFAVQADIAMNIANALEAEFSPEEQQQLGKQQTSSEAAYRAYLKGRTLGQEREHSAAAQALSQAVKIDPEYAAAHAELASIYAVMHGFGISTETGEAAINLARSHASTAIALDPGNGLAYAVLGELDKLAGNWEQAEDELTRARGLAPNSSRVMEMRIRFFMDQGDFAEAVNLGERMVEMDPLNPLAHTIAGIMYALAGDIGAAREASLRTVELSPLNWNSLTIAAVLEFIVGNRDQGLQLLSRAELLEPASLDSQQMRLAVSVYARANEMNTAQQFMERYEDYAKTNPVSQSQWVFTYAALGNREKAMAHLQLLINNPQQENDFLAYLFLKTNGWRIPVLDEPAFVEARARMPFRNEID